MFACFFPCSMGFVFVTRSKGLFVFSMFYGFCFCFSLKRFVCFFHVLWVLFLFLALKVCLFLFLALKVCLFFPCSICFLFVPRSNGLFVFSMFYLFCFCSSL